MRWETRAQGVKKDRAGLAQPVAVCEMSVQHLRGAGTVCKMTMQRLHGLFTVCKMTVQHLHGPFTVCGETMQHLHSLFTVCETIMQHLHSLAAVCAPVPRRLIIRPLPGPSGGGVCNTPLPSGTRKNFAAPAGANAIRPYPGTIIRPYMYPANFAAPAGAVRRRPLTLPP